MFLVAIFTWDADFFFFLHWTIFLNEMKSKHSIECILWCAFEFEFSILWKREWSVLDILFYWKFQIVCDSKFVGQKPWFLQNWNGNLFFLLLHTFICSIQVHRATLSHDEWPEFGLIQVFQHIQHSPFKKMGIDLDFNCIQFEIRSKIHLIFYQCMNHSTVIVVQLNTKMTSWQTRKILLCIVIIFFGHEIIIGLSKNCIHFTFAHKWQT